MRNCLPMNTIAIALGLHVRVGIEDNLWGRKGERKTSVQQVEQVARIARELGRDIADGDDARRIYRIGEQWQSTEETLTRLGMTPNREPGQRGVPLRQMKRKVGVGVRLCRTSFHTEQKEQRHALARP